MLSALPDRRGTRRRKSATAATSNSARLMATTGTTVTNRQLRHRDPRKTLFDWDIEFLEDDQSIHLRYRRSELGRARPLPRRSHRPLGEVITGRRDPARSSRSGIFRSGLIPRSEVMSRNVWSEGQQLLIIQARWSPGEETTRPGSSGATSAWEINL